jgi:RND family efflux transporter MFP subunit
MTSRLLGATCTAGTLVAVLSVACGGRSGAVLDPSLIHTVERGDLVITVRERGEIKAAQNTRVASEVEGRATLIHLVPEGTVVATGDIVAKLDTSAIAEKRASEEISVAKAEAGVLQARKAVEIMEKELRSAESARESELEIARLRARKLLGQPRFDGLGAAAKDTARSEGTNAQVLDELRALLADETTDALQSSAVAALDSMVDSSSEVTAVVHTGAAATVEGDAAALRAARAVKPVSGDLIARIIALFDGEENLALQMGEMGNQILKQVSEINLSRADLELATETLRYSEQLSAEGFLSRGELNRDRIDHQRRLADMSLAWSNLELLVTYTLPEERITARQGVADAQLALESQRAVAEARRVRESSELARAEAELEIARQNLARLEQQLQKGVLRAPSPGLVVYGRFDWDEPVHEGLEVRERQEIVVLPDISHMIAELLVPEAQVDLVAVDQSARIVVDAFPGREFRARVGNVSSLPDVQGSWRRDVKVYGVRMDIDGGNPKGSLRPGMNATVEIEVGTLRGVLTIPLPALERSGDRHFVWRVTPSGPVAAEVTIGRNSLTHVEIVSGLTEGQQVHLVPPEGAKLPEPERKTPTEGSELDIDSAGESGGITVSESAATEVTDGGTTAAAATPAVEADVKPVE